MTLALFEVVDPTRGAVRCRECGAVDMVTTDTWTTIVGRDEGLVICGGCGASDDIHSFPYPVDLLEGTHRCERCDALIVGTPVLNEWGGGPPYCGDQCREDEAERRASR